jgi:hypothetical protein
MDILIPTWAVTICAVSLSIGAAGFGVWLGADGLKDLVKLVRRTLASEARIQHRWTQNERETLNYWIRDSFRNKADATKERHRADQEQSMRRQLAKGANHEA